MTIRVMIINDDTDNTRALSVVETDKANPGQASETPISAGGHKEFTIWDTKTISISEIHKNV